MQFLFDDLLKIFYLFFTQTVTEEYLILGQEIEKANNIVIVGGGATGVEMAGEIGDKYKLKKIVLIHSHEELVCDGMGPKFQTNIKSGLENMNVELFLGDKVENMTDLDFSVYKRQTIKTSKVGTFKNYIPN